MAGASRGCFFAALILWPHRGVGSALTSQTTQNLHPSKAYPIKRSAAANTHGAYSVPICWGLVSCSYDARGVRDRRVEASALVCGCVAASVSVARVESYEGLPSQGERARERHRRERAFMCSDSTPT